MTSLVGADGFPLEAAISTTDTRKLACIEEPTCHMKPPKSGENQYLHFISHLKCLQHKLTLQLIGYLPSCLIEAETL